MTLMLPEAYIHQINRLLGPSSSADFWRSYEQPRTQGLRINPLKLSAGDDASKAVMERLQALFRLEPVPWCDNGYYYNDEARPGKHAYHSAGLYYIQEPSAMSAVELLNPQPGEIVLDLAAAPGGKSTQIAGKLRGEGLLISNEIHPARAKILSENIERLGAANAIVTSEPPDRLAARFPQFFDKIMLDAPCSGEGMFRKDPEAIGEWSPAHVEMCAARQADILREAAKLLKSGGLLAYSTCTFNEAENERTIEAFVREHPGFELLRSERIWPHLQRGEGHFVALLRLRPDAAAPAVAARAPRSAARGQTAAPAHARGRTNGSSPLREATALFEQFRRDALPELLLPAGEPLLFGEQLYWLPVPAGSQLSEAALAGLRVLRPGLHLAEVRKNRVEPAHALALALPPAAARSGAVVSFAADSAEAAAYLRGWTLVAADGFPLGWAKASDGQLKNHYPKGLRLLH